MYALPTTHFLASDNDVSKIKSLLLNQLDNYTGAGNSTATKKIKDSCFQQQVSSAVFVVGQTGNKLLLVEEALSSYNQNVSIARVSGDVHSVDHDAMSAIARQLRICTSADNFSLCVEALQKHFEESRRRQTPTVLLLDAVHHFARSARQPLLYTLLDLMHRREFYFLVIGVTSRCDVHLRLEKRVLSRLNSQTVVVHPLSLADANDASKHLCDHLLTPLLQCSGSEEKYFTAFSAQLKQTFFSSSADLDSVTQLLRRLVATGQSINYLLTILRCAVLRLSTAEPYLTCQLIQDCSVPSLAQQLQGAPKAELFLTVAIHRASQKLKHKRKLAASTISDTGTQKRSHTSATSSAAVNALCMCSTGDVIKEFDVVSGLLRKKSLTRRAVIASLQALADSNIVFLSNSTGQSVAITNRKGNTITDSTMVALIPTAEEICEAFRSSELRIPDKMRRAAVDVSGTVLLSGEILGSSSLIE